MKTPRLNPITSFVALCGAAHLRHRICLASHGGLVIAANESTAAEDDMSAANEALGGAFEVIDGGKMKVPFGEVPVMVNINGRNVRSLQRIDAEAGNDMVADLGGWIKRRLVGRPIFAGHPYHPDSAEAAKWPDKRSRGSIREIEVANDGIVLVPSYNSIGKEEVEDGQFVFHSPQWRLRPVMGANGKQEVKDGMPVFRPFSIHSAGLTNNPNIEVPPLVAANEDGGRIDVTKIIAALAEAGIAKEDDDELTLLRGIASMKEMIQWSRDRKAGDARELALLKEKLPSAANEATREELLQSLLNAAEAQAANEAASTALQQRFDAARAAHVDAVMKPLIAANKIKGAEKDGIRAELISAANEGEIDQRIAGLSGVRPKLGTTGGVTDELKDDSKRIVMAANEQSERARRRAEAMASAMAEITQGRKAKTGDGERAWNLAASREPELFSR